MAKRARPNTAPKRTKYKFLGLDLIINTKFINIVQKRRRITSVDGNSEQSHINNFVDNEFLSVDSLAFRKHSDKVVPDVDMNYKFTSILGDEKELVVPMTTQFFWPSTK